MAENDEKIEKLLSELPDNLDSVSFLSEKYSELAGYNMDGALASRVSEALKRIRDFAEEKLNNFNAEDITPEGAVAYQSYLNVSLESERSEEMQKRDAEVFAAIAPKLEEFDEENDISDVDENADIAANCEAWDKVAEGIRPFEEVTREDGSKVYRVTSGFEGLGGFFAALDRESGEELCEMARLEAVQNLGAGNAPSDDAEANRSAYIEELNGVLDQTGFQLWQEYQKRLFAEKHPELLSGFDFQAAMQLEPRLNKPEEHIKALSEAEIKNADSRILRGEPLNLAEMAGVCKGRALLNKPARAELMAVIERAAAAEKVEGSDLVALQYLLNEVERVPEYKSLAKEENLTAARRHVSGFRGNLNMYRNFQQTLSRQTVEFERNSFADRKVFKSSLAAVVCARSAAMVRKAERLSFKTKAKAVWSKIRAWDEKTTKEHPAIYGMAKSVATSMTIGATTGVAGLLAYSGYKLYKQVKGNYKKYKEEAEKAKTEGREYYKNYRSYFFAKENRKEAWQIGSAAILSTITAGFGAAALAEHGVAAVTGLSGQVAQHGVSGLSFGGGAVFDNIKDAVTNPSWEKVGGLAKSAATSVVTNARVISSTSVSLLTGIMTSREVAKQQREAEEQLDALLKQYGVGELPTDKKLLKLRSSDPKAYALEMLKQSNIALNSEQVKTLNSITKTIDARRKEKNMRRWGAVGGSALGLAMAGMFGAKPEDLQPTPAEAAPDAPAAAPDVAPQTGIAAENRNYADMFNFDGNGDDVLLSDKLNGWGGNRFQNMFNDGTDLADVNASAENGQNVDAAVGADGIDLANLSDEQKHDLDMLFKRYPRAASLILEGSENPAVTDSPSNGVISSAKLQAMYEGGDIPADKLEDMVKFAGEHFDAKGNFVGPDAEALNAEAENWQSSHSRAGRGSSGGGMSGLSDNENSGAGNSGGDNGAEPADAPADENGQLPGGGNDDVVSEPSDDGNAAKDVPDGENDGQNAEEAEVPAVQPTDREISGKGVNLTYRIEESDNEYGYNLVRDGDVKVDKAMLKQMYGDIEYKDGEYVAANGHIHHQDVDIVRGRVKLLCTEITKENYIAEDIAARGNPTEAEQAFLARHESHLDEYGVKTKSDAMYADVESKAVETEPVSGSAAPETVAEEQMPDGRDPAAGADEGNAVSDAERDGQDNSAAPAAEPGVPHEIHQKGINVTYSIEDSPNGSGFRLRYNGSVAVDQEMLREMKNGITRDGDMYVAANGAIRSQNFNIVNSKVTMLCQQATVQNAIADQLLSSGAELSDAEKLFLKSHAAQMAKYGIEYTPPQNAAQADVHVTNAHAETAASANAGDGYSAALLTRGENGIMTTQSGYSFSIDAKGNIIHQSVLNEAAQAQAEAEIYAALSSSKNLAANEQAFVADYAQTHKVGLYASAEATAVSHAEARSDVAQTGGNDEVQPSAVRNGGGRPVARDPYNNDDIYYRPEQRGSTGVAAASRDVATPVGDGELEDSREVDGSQHTAHDATVVDRHRIWQYKGIKGHYSFVDTGGNAPVVDISHLNNVPEQLNLREHIRGTHEWNGSATYEEYLGGAIRGTPNEVNAQLQAFCKNLEGSDVVYRDMRQQIAGGYEPSAAEQKWMRGFEQDLRTIGLGYVDGKLTPVQSPQSLKAQWYGTSDNIKTSQILQARAQRYNGY